jgi:hypothetical protein
MLLLLTAGSVHAQWDLPVRVELNGPEPADRQVTGLADPDAPHAAVSHDAARATSMSMAEAFGSTVLLADLFPAPAAYSVGMSVTIIPQGAVAPGAQLDLNGLGPVPIQKWGNLPVEAGDLPAGVPVRLVYTGSAFLVLGGTYRSCPEGFSAVGPRFCVSDSTQATLNFYQALNFCAGQNARLCSFNEWIQACRSNPAFLPTVDVAEWVDHAANDAGGAKRMGLGSNGNGSVETVPSCTIGQSSDPASQGRVRCCRNR